jgi:hypothetical protein
MPQFTPVQGDPFAQDNQVQANSSGNRGDDRRIRGALQSMAPGQVQQAPLPPPQMRFDAYGDSLTPNVTRVHGDPFAPQVGMGEDMARSGLSGLLQGSVDAIGGLPGDARELLLGADQGLRKNADALARSNSPLLRGVGDATLGVQDILGLMGRGLMPQVPTSEQIGTGRQELFGQDWQPQTTAGEFARTVGQFAPAGVVGEGGLARKAATVLFPALGSEAAGQATEGKPYEGGARMAGAIVGSLPAMLVGRPSGPQRMLRDAAANATESDVNLATALMQEGRAQGVDLTLSEALQQVNPGTRGMGRLQRVIEGTPEGEGTLGPMMARRPEQVRQAATGVLDTMSPPVTQPGMAGARAQNAAERGLKQTRKAVNAPAEPFYKAMEGEVIPPDAYRAMAADPAYQEALGALRSDRILNSKVAHLPDENLAVVNAVQKQLDTMGKNAAPSPVNPQGSAEKSAAFGTARDMVDALATDASKNWRAARDTVSSGRAQYLEPLQRGALGDVAKSPELATQTGALFPDKPFPGQANETGQAMTMLGAADQPVPGMLLRQHLERALSEVTQDLQSGPNPWGGAGFAAKVAGNPEQAATLASAADVVGSKPQLDSLLNVLRATGKRQPPGSLTAYNAKDMERLGEAGVMGEGAKAAANPFRWAGNALQDFQTQRNASALAEILADQSGKGAQALHDVMKSPKARSILLPLLLEQNTIMRDQ